MLQEHTNWLLSAGVELSEAAQNRVEVSSLYSYEGEGFELSKIGAQITEPGYVDAVGVFHKTIN